MLSFVFSAMLKERQQQQNSALRQQTGQQSDPNSTQFAVVLPPAPNPQQSINSPLIPLVNTELNGFEDPPPPYFSDNSPPPKYEEVVDSQK